MNLDVWRRKIDNIDEKIIRLLAERIRIASEIGKKKTRHNQHTEDKAREKVVLENVSRIADEEQIDSTEIVNIYKMIIATSKRMQDRIK